jgi:NAD(P)H-flavin reductase
MPRKIRCRVDSVTDHGGRVYTVDLSPEGAVPAFRPGQFLHLTVDEYDPSGFWPESRVFSIASSPRERSRLRICYSVKGRYTTRMEQALAPGRDVWVKLPYGDFVIDDGGEAVLVAGGTGISAFSAFIEALSPQSAQRIALVYGVRTPGLFLFGDMILDRMTTVPGFRGVFLSEDAAGWPEPRRPERLEYGTGRISIDAVLRAAGDGSAVSSPAFYLSGPPMMLASLGDGLRAAGVPPEQIRADAWD